jgi:2-polyprenyl-6-methoxyphenol hydroxylase-like FAD-dependent oxidoreductase
MLLYRAAIDRLGSGAITTGHRITGYEHGRDGVRVHCTMRDGTSERIDGSLLLGADGLHSAVRAQMFPGDGGPRWGGSVLWRGASSGTPLRTGGSFIVLGDPTQRFVVFPISEPDPSTGLQVQNWIAELAFDANRGWRRGDWNTQVTVDEFVGAFEGWTFDWLDVPDLIRRADHVFEYPMVDRDPVDHWVHGSVALIGDAAHAMYPVGSNGASQAIVDARVVGAKLVRHGVGREALHAYEARLLASRSALVLRNRRLGPGSILGVADADFDKDFGYLATMSPDELATFTADYHTVSAAAVDRLNTSASTITHVS